MIKQTHVLWLQEQIKLSKSSIVDETSWPIEFILEFAMMIMWHRKRSCDVKIIGTVYFSHGTVQKGVKPNSILYLSNHVMIFCHCKIDIIFSLKLYDIKVNQSIVAAIIIEGNINPSTAKATFFKSTRTPRFLKTI